jgi:hypothetical protein
MTHALQLTPYARCSRRALLTGAVTLAGAVVLASCSGSATTSSPTSATTPPSATVTGAPPGAAASPVAAASPASVSKVNANTASVTELQRAFETAGISNAARWAREVEEYRPYPTDDPSFAKLRRELAKYNPGPGVVDQIIATLAL